MGQGQYNAIKYVILLITKEEKSWGWDTLKKNQL